MYGKDYECSMKKMQFGDSYIDWITEGVYLGITLLVGKSFKIDVRERKINFVIMFNNVASNGGSLPEEYLMEIYNKQCIPIFMYGGAICSLSAEEKRKVDVCLN